MDARIPWSVFIALALAPNCTPRSEQPVPVVAVYEGPSKLSPYPSNHFLRGGRVSLGGDVATANPLVGTFTRTLPDLEALDGFSTAGGAFVSFSDELDAEGLVERSPSDFTVTGTPIALVDLDAGRALPIVVRYVSWKDDERSTSPDYTLFVEPAVPLEPKTRHVLVFSDALRAKSGAAVTAAPATRALVSGDAEGEYGESLRAALPAVEKVSGTGVDHIVLATMFTTQTVYDDLASIAKAVRAGLAPRGTSLVLEKRATDPGDQRIRFVGTFPAPEYRAPRPDGKWRVNNGVVEAQSTSQLEYFLAFTRGARSGPRPVVVLGHGLGRDKDQVWDLAKYLADLDVAVIAIDAPEHGSRHDPPYPPGKTDEAEATLNFIGADLVARSLDAGIARDNFRQLASDTVHLFKFMSGLGSVDVLPAGAPDGIPDIDPTHVLYMGISFGAVVGPTMLAFEPEVRAACLVLGGAPLGTVIRDSRTLGLIRNIIMPGEASDADFARWVVMVQGIIDPGDPVNYAPFVASRPLGGVPGWRGTDVLLQEAIEDAIIPNSSSERLARALGVVQVEPVLAPIPGLDRAPGPLVPNGAMPVRGLLQLDHADGEHTDHTTFFATTEARRQYVDFIRSALGESRATIK